ncbi:MAG: conjugative transposon protein TraN [Rikenellaceae bacterium]
MRKSILTLFLVGITTLVNAQEHNNEVLILEDSSKYENYQPSTPYNGFTKDINYDRMIPPHGLEVTYNKTVHVIFPSGVKYVDLGSSNLIAAKADGAENVIRVKSTVENFSDETNLSVITESGSFYTFNVRYAAEPSLLNIEMIDFIHDGSSVNSPNNSLDIYLSELGNESPKLVHLMMESIYKNNKRKVKHIGSKLFGVQYLLNGIYTHNGLLYFHTEIKNMTNIPYDIDYITFKIVDKKLLKRTAIGEKVISPIRAYNYVLRVDGRDKQRTVFAFDKFTIADDKQLIVQMHEKNGGRHQSFTIENSDIVNARVVSQLKVMNK